MSAPAGWHLQPDGQERYWDGSQWTEQFRAPLPSDPTAPPPPSWAGSADETQALDVNSTQAIPAPQQQQPQQPQQDYAYPQAGYPQTGQPQTGNPPAGYPQTAYGEPGGQYAAPPQRQGNGVAKGCLIAGVIGVLLLIAVVVGGLFVFNRAADTISESFPSGLPTELPSDFPSDLPTEGLGQSIDVTVGEGFELPRATIESGWGLETATAGSIVNITGMRATLSSADGFPVLFTMSFPDKAGTEVQTVCTAASGSTDSTVDVSCVPLFGDVAGATRAKVTASL